MPMHRQFYFSIWTLMQTHWTKRTTTLYVLLRFLTMFKWFEYCNINETSPCLATRMIKGMMELLYEELRRRLNRFSLERRRLCEYRILAFNISADAKFLKPQQSGIYEGTASRCVIAVSVCSGWKQPTLQGFPHRRIVSMMPLSILDAWHFHTGAGCCMTVPIPPPSSIITF